MAELIFIAVTIFVAYTIFTIIGDKNDAPAEEAKAPSQEAAKETIATTAVAKPVSKPAAKTSAASTRKATVPAKAAAKPKVTEKKEVAPKATPKAKAVAEKKPATSSRATKAAPVVIDSLKNPKTGEVVKIPNSYAFAKRWIKDALVEEKLLDKVYKNAELDNAANAKIQEAMDKLKQLPKYQ